MCWTVVLGSVTGHCVLDCGTGFCDRSLCVGLWYWVL